MNTTVQTLGRVAILGGGVLVSLVNVIMFQDTESLPQADKAAIAHANLAGLLDGVNVASLGLMAAVTWQLGVASLVC